MSKRKSAGAFPLAKIPEDLSKKSSARSAFPLAQVPENLKAQGQAGNIAQNTSHKARQQDR